MLVTTERRLVTTEQEAAPLFAGFSREECKLLAFRHPGLVVGVAARCGVSPQYVSMILYGKRTNPSEKHDAVVSELNAAIRASLTGIRQAMPPAETILDAPATRKAPGRTNYSRTRQSSTVFAQAGRQG